MKGHTMTTTTPDTETSTVTDADLAELPGDEKATINLPSGRIITVAERKELLRKLRAEFPLDQIEKLPKHVRREDRNYGNCKPGSRDNVSIDGVFCGGRHALAVHLDYIGHAGITMRLNEVAGPDDWDWEFMHVDLPSWVQGAVAKAIEGGHIDFAQQLIREHGQPIQRDNGLWIRLTVLGVTKIGFGDASGKSGANATKELYGDAIRNAAMRFGVATYLWSKSEDAARKKTEEYLAEHGDDNQEAWTTTRPAREQARGSQTRLEGEVEKTLHEWGKDFDRALAAGPDAMYSLRTMARNAKAPEQVLAAINKTLSDYEASQQPAGQGTEPPAPGSAPGYEPQGDIAQERAFMEEQQQLDRIGGDQD